MQIGRQSEGMKKLQNIMNELQKEEPEWYQALHSYGPAQIQRILEICDQKDPRVITRQLRAEGFVRPAELTEEAMKAYPAYEDYFINPKNI